MAPRRSAEVVEEPQLGGLKFNEPLSWRAGKAIATGELLRRLDALGNELREMDQEETDKDSLTHVAKELAGQNLLSHKDKGVRAFTACALVDILRLCAPDAPFTPTMLKDIFNLFIVTILPALSDPSNAYNTQHKYVLTSLAEVKSILLVLDIATADALMQHLFSSFFDIISGASTSSSGEQISKDVDYHMTQILVTLVDEAQNLPTAVIDVIIAQFLRVAATGAGSGKTDTAVDDKQSTLLVKEFPEAYNMAKTICNSCPEKMARYISIYFNDVIMDVSANGASRSNGHRRSSVGGVDSDDEGPMGPTEADMNELRKAHRLLRELWRASPPVLQNVIPQLEAELSAENVQLRLMATETLGDIISGIGAAGPPPPPTMDPAAYPPLKLDEYQPPVASSILITPSSPQSFAQTYPSVYNSFLSRKNDKSLVIRSAWTTACGRILVTAAGGIGLSREDQNTLVKALAERLGDGDEKVRLAAVKSIAGFSFPDIMTVLASGGGVNKEGSVLSSLADRVRDRKHVVRAEGMTILSRIWGVAAGEIAAGNESVIAALGTIPSKIIDVYYTNDVDVNVLLDHVIFEQLIPLSYPPTKTKGSKAANGDSQASQTNGVAPIDADKIRVERILLLVKSLDAKSKKAFFALQARQPTYSNVIQAFLKRCEEYNGGITEGNTKEIKSKLDAVIKYLADLLPDPLRTTQELQKYAKMHDRRSYQLLRFAIASESDFKTVYKGIKEFQKRIKDSKEAPAGLLDTLMPIIYRSASLIYNRSHLPAILQYSRSDEEGLGATAHEVNREISEKMPQVFQSNVKELCKSLQEDAPSESRPNDLGSVETLRACAEFAKTRPTDLPRDRKFQQTLLNFAQYGTPAKAAKYAVRILMAVSDRKELHSKDLMEKMLTSWTYGEEHFLTKLATISQLSMEQNMVEEYGDEIIDVTIQQILLKVQTAAKDTDPSWQADTELDEECEAKCWALKILVNKAKTFADTDPAKGKAIATPIFKLLNKLIIKEGELSNNNNTPRHHKSRLRLRAAQLLMKLCRNKVFDELFKPQDFDRLALVAQDKDSHVRRGFIEKLQKYIVKGHLPNRFYTIIFLTAFEPELEFKNSIITWIRSRVKQFHDKKIQIMESTFARLLSLLAHHPDYSADPEELLDHARYILYYLNTVSSESNLALIYKYAERVKQAGDGLYPRESGKLYVMSDLAQAVIRRWEQKKGWNMQIWPSKVGLPIGLFAALPNHDVAQEIAERAYLPDDMDEKLDKLVRNIDKKRTKRKTEDFDDGDESHPAKKQRSSSHPKPSRPSTIKKEKPVKEKKMQKRRVRDDDEDEDEDADEEERPGPSSAERRKSGRSASKRKSYADRDDSEDDKEMWNGVAQWEFIPDGKNGRKRLLSEEREVESPESEAAEEKEPATPEPEDGEEEEEREATPSPPKSSGRKTTRKAPMARKAKSPIVSAKSPPAKSSPPKSTPVKSSPVKSSAVKASALKSSAVKQPERKGPASKVVKQKQKAKSPLVVKKLKAAVAEKPVARGKGRSGKGKKVEKVKDIFDMDESE